MDEWEKTLLPENENFFTDLNIHDFTDADYTHLKRIFKYLNIINIRKYHDLYDQSDLLLLADVFENFQNMCLEK